jgi:hypothetical protein
MEDPLLNEPVMLYLMATKRVISIFIALERNEENMAHHVRQRSYEGVETTLSWRPKDGLEGFMASCKPKHYLLTGACHISGELSSLADIIRNREVTGCVAK